MALLSDRVRERRQELGWTQEELAEKSGVGQSSINRIESGNTPNPRLHTIQAIADALRVSMAWLQGLDGADPPAPDAGTQESPSAVVSDINPPTFGHIQGWTELERAAKKKAPDIDGWVWDELRDSNPLFAARIPLTVAAVVTLARVVNEHGTPPSSRRK